MFFSLLISFVNYVIIILGKFYPFKRNFPFVNHTLKEKVRFAALLDSLVVCLSVVFLVLLVPRHFLYLI